MKPLLQFISGYGSPEPPQSIEEIQGDFQLAGLSPLLSSHLSRSPTPKILDIGCGNGVLMAKLVEIEAFKNYPKLEYVGFDFPDKLSGAFETANKYRILQHARLLPIDEQWIEHMTDPCIVVIRNVFHELKIDEAARRIYEICHNLPANSVFILQDMTTLPTAEKGRAGWLGKHLADVFEAGGIRTNLTPDTSKRGVDVFLIEGKRRTECELSKENIIKLLIQAREEQLRLLGSKYGTIEQKPDNMLPISRLTHDIAAISLELQKFGRELKGQLKIDDEQTVASTFSLAFSSLSDHDLSELQKNFKYPKIRGFQNRGYHINALDDFLRSDKTIFILKAGPLMGKRTVVWWSLDQRLKDDRLPLSVNLKEGADILTIMEDIAVQLGLGKFIDVEVLASLRSLPTREMRQIIGRAVKRFASKVLLILDGFENVVDPEGRIENEDIAWLIDFWSSVHKAKIIIETRSEIKQLPFERCQSERMSTFPSSEKKKHQYTIQFLHELVPVDYRLPDAEFGGYPIDLLDTLDNHPYFSYVAGTIIRNNPDSTCLSNQDFIANLKAQLYNTLLSTFGLTDVENEMISSLTLVQDAFPLKFVDMVIENNVLSRKLLEKGLLVENSRGRFRPLGIVGGFIRANKSRDERNKIEKKWHQVFADVFRRLYAIESDPSFYRQYYYHAALAGDKSELKVYNLPEISSCAESWDRSGNFADALWAYRKIQESRRLHPREQMRMAKCLIRTNNIDDGKKLYQDLLNRYKDWKGVKSSYADSLLYIGGHAKKALNVLSKIPKEERDYYWHRQAARCYRQLSKRNEAYKEYEEAILSSPMREVWQTIQELVNYAREGGDDETEREWIEDYTWNRLKLRSDAVRIDLGAFYERKGELIDAEKLLIRAYKTNSSNAYCILPLIKTLCKRGELRKANDILERTPTNVSPEIVFISAKVFYLKSLKRFKDGKKLLLTLPMNRRDKDSIHRWGQWADLFLTWSHTLQGKEKISIAREGLKFVKETMETHNVPAMMTCRELAKTAGDHELQANLEEKIHRINPNILLG